MRITVTGGPLCLLVRRRQEGHTATEAAARLGITRHHLSRLECGRVVPGAELRERLRDVYGVPVRERWPLEYKS